VNLKKKQYCLSTTIACAAKNAISKNHSKDIFCGENHLNQIARKMADLKNQNLFSQIKHCLCMATILWQQQMARMHKI